MSGDLENRIQALEAEVQRLRAREEIIHTFNQYSVSYTHLTLPTKA